MNVPAARLMRLRGILFGIRDGALPLPSRNHGLCSNVGWISQSQAVMDALDTVLVQAFGTYSYPVRLPGWTAKDAEVAYEVTRRGHADFWDRSSPYGAARWKLVDDCIEFIDSYLACTQEPVYV